MLSILSLMLLLGHCNELQSQQCPVLHLLNVRPIRHSSDGASAVWDRGLDVSPAGHLAVEQINNRSDILPEYKLKLIDIDSEVCGVNTISRGIETVYSELMNHSHCIVGVVGLYCTDVTNVISPIFSHPNIGGYIQIAASTSRLDMNRATPEAEANLFYMVGVSSVFNQATLALMHALGWRRIGIIHHPSTFFFDSIANDFVQRTLLSDVKLAVCIPITHKSDFKAFDMLRDHEARISYWSVTFTESAHLLCEAYNRGLYWPGYVYILREPTLDNIFKTQTSCTKKQLMVALEKAFLLQYRFFTDDNTILESGLSYSEYWRMYNEKLQEFACTNKVNLSATASANALYDQVWAFALAITKLIKSHNVSFKNHTIKQIGAVDDTISQLLRSELKNLSFQGATKFIQFNENQESSPYVSIFQVQNGTQKLIGIYDPSIGMVTNVTISDVPNDTFRTEYTLLPPWLGICSFISQGLNFGLITTNLILIVKWKNEKDIKAISPLLSLLMMIGCYSQCVTPVFQLAHRMLVLNNNITAVKSLCYLKTWTWIGIDLVLAVLFLKLLRVYHIFRTFRKTSRYWSDQCLFIYTLAICAGKTVLVICWNSTDSIDIEVCKTYVNTLADQLPYYVATVTCNKSGVWLAAAALYSSILLSLVVVLAVATRHIKKDNFKDTKKVNIFTFLVVIIIITNISLHIFFDKVANQTGAEITEWLPSFAIPLLCQVCLFFPKTLPLAFEKIKSSSHDNNFKF